MNKLFSDTQTCGYSKNLKKPRALKTFRMNLFCVRRQSTNGSSFPGDIVHSKTVGLRQVSEYHGSDKKIKYEYSSLPKSLDRDLFSVFFKKKTTTETRSFSQNCCSKFSPC